MAYGNGFQYVSGPAIFKLSTVSSNATFKAFNPVSRSSVGRTLIETKSSSTVLYGIAQQDAASSLPGSAYVGKALVLVPLASTVFAVKVQTGVAASALSVGQAYGIEKAGNYMRLDTDSAATPFVVIIPRDDDSTIDSADSSVWVNILQSRLAPVASMYSQTEF